MYTPIGVNFKRFIFFLSQKIIVLEQSNPSIANISPIISIALENGTQNKTHNQLSLMPTGDAVFFLFVNLAPGDVRTLWSV